MDHTTTIREEIVIYAGYIGVIAGIIAILILFYKMFTGN